ncbi:MAG: hypothetical protein QOH95_149 [Gaiellaceae bacterium]|nr:hypothetical protein [Gaiellaceae bacterium]
MKRLTLLAALAALLAASAAPAATAPQYRAKLNGICRSFTPRLKASQETMAHATTAAKPKVFEAALRRFLVLGLRQNHQLEGVAVPRKLQRQMTPIIKRLKKIDPHVHKALVHSRAGDLKGTRSQLKTISKLSEPISGQLDAAGLLECGSNQL